MLKCTNHPDTEPSGMCRECGKFFCSDCLVNHDSESYCRVCFSKVFPDEAVLKDAAAKISPRQTSKQPAEKVSNVAQVSPVQPPPVSKKPARFPPSVRKQAGSVFASIIKQLKANLVTIASYAKSWINLTIAWLTRKDIAPKAAHYVLMGGAGIFVLLLAVIVPIVLFTSCNGTGKHSQIIVVGPEVPPPPPPPNFTLTQQETSAVQPSQGDQTVNYSDALSVTIPGGALENAQQLTISKIQNPPPPPIGAMEHLAVYDINFSEQHEFDKDLTFTFAYDPKVITEDIIAEGSLSAFYWSEAENGWLGMPVTIDSTTHTITAHSMHNGPVSFTRSIIRGLGNFIGVWNDTGVERFIYSVDIADLPLSVNVKTDIAVELKRNHKLLVDIRTKYAELEKKLAQSTGDEKNVILSQKATLDKQLDELQTKTSALTQKLMVVKEAKTYIPEYGKDYYTRLGIPIEGRILHDLDVFLNRAYERYGYKDYTVFAEKNNFLVPNTPIKVYLSTWGDKHNKLLDSINIDLDNTANATDLGNNSAHELFHMVQNQYYWAVTMFTRNWWLEGTAEYAAARIASKSDFVKEIDAAKWMARSFYSWDNDHAVANCYFLDYLITTYDINFKDMFETVAAAYRCSIAFEDYLLQHTKLTLKDNYRNYVEYLLFHTSSPWKAALEFRTRRIDVLNEEYVFNFTEPLTSRYLGMVPVVEGGERKFSIRISDGNAIRTRLDVYQLVGNVRGKEHLKHLDCIGNYETEELNKLTSIDVTLNQGDGLYLLVTYNGREAQGDLASVVVTIKDVVDPTLSIESDFPKDSKGTVCTEYHFTAKPKNMPPGVKLEWFEDNKPLGKTDQTVTHSFNQPGPRNIKVKATWKAGSTSDFKESDLTCNVGKPGLILKASPAKGIIKNQVIFNVDPEYIPDGTEYIWTINNAEKGKGLSFPTSFDAATKYKVGLQAKWDNNGCKGDVDASPLTYEVSKPGVTIVATPSTGIAGKECIFQVSGAESTKDLMAFSWDFGDTGGEGNTATYPPEPGKHTYQNAGKYNVRLGLINSQGRFFDTVELQYKVVAAYSLTLDMPSSGPESKEYTFKANPTGIPNGAFYTWFINGDQVLQGNDKTTFTTKPNYFKAGKKYNFYVVATWLDTDKQGQTAEARASFELLDVVPVISIKLPSPAPGKPLDPLKEHNFYAESPGIPDDATYEWYINGTSVLKAQGKDGTVATAPAGFFKDGDYEIRVIAKWKGADLKEQWAEDSAKFKVEKTIISLTIIPPPEIQTGKAQENTKYYFTYDKTGIPDNATFTWYSDGKEVGKGATIGLAFAAGPHKIELKANWQDSDAAKTKHEQTKDLSFTIGSTQPPDDSGPGWYLIKVEPTVSEKPVKSWGDPSIKCTENSCVRNCCDPDCHNTFHVSYTWTSLPKYLKPNVKYQITFTQTGSSSGCILGPTPDNVFAHVWDLSNRHRYLQFDGKAGTYTITIPSDLPQKDKVMISLVAGGIVNYYYEYR